MRWLALALALASVRPARGQGPAPEAVAEPTLPGAAQVDDTPAGPTSSDPTRLEAAAEGPEALRAALEALAAQHAARLRVESYGRSRGGRPLLLATLGDGRGGEAGGRPALLVVGGAAGDVRAAALDALALLRLLLADPSNARVEALSKRGPVLVVPCARPDAWPPPPPVSGASEASSPAGPTAEPVVFDRNFPVGWDPWRDGPGSGPYPLSEPETRALAELLDARREVTALVSIVAEAPAPAPAARAHAGPPLDPADLAVYRRLFPGASALGLRAGVQELAAGEPAHPGGGLLEFAHRQLGAFSFALTAAPRAPGNGAEGAPGRAGAEAVLFLSRHLPALRLGEPRIERLGEVLWQVDLVVENTGTLPTVSRAGAATSASEPLELYTSGPRVLAAARAADPRGPFAAVDREPQALVLGRLEGGEACAVRLVLEGEEGDSTTVSLSSRRAGTLTQSFSLR